MLVDWVDVEYREDGALKGAQVRVVDFANPSNNEFTAVNQFNVIENKHHIRLDGP